MSRESIKTGKEQTLLSKMRKPARRSMGKLASAAAMVSLGVGVVAAPAPARPNRAKDSRLSGQAQAANISLARKIIGLARGESPRSRLLRPNNLFIDEVSVTISAPTAPGYSRQKGWSTDRYTLYADIPAPANGRYADRHRLNPHEFEELDPRKVVGLYLNEGYSTQLAFEKTDGNGWAFRGAYMFAPNGPISLLRANTHPILPHERHFTSGQLATVNHDAAALVDDAAHHTPIDFSSGMPFAPIRGENNAFLVIG